MIVCIDHVAITVSDMERASQFYVNVLGARIASERMRDGRPSIRRLVMGGAVFNLHQADNDVALVARHPTVGAADVCLRWAGSAQGAAAHLQRLGIAIVEGPSPRQTADNQPSHSVYFHDPDGALIELMARDPA